MSDTIVDPFGEICKLHISHQMNSNQNSQGSILVPNVTSKSLQNHLRPLIKSSQQLAGCARRRACGPDP